jgi:N utilization substance protein B
MKARSPRSRARSWVLQILYAWELAGDGPLLEYGESALAQRRIADRYRPYVDRLLGGLDRHLPEVDARLEETLANWRIERLSAIDRGILRIGAIEILKFSDVPHKVAIHEAIRLAERYGSDDSPRFVNGVLDAVSRNTPVAG